MASKLANMKTRMASMKAKAQQAVGTVLQTAEISGSAFLLSYARGRMADVDGNWDVAGVPVSLGAGIGLHVLGLAGVFGSSKPGSMGMDAHVHNLADGMLAEYVVTIGTRLGAEGREPAAKVTIAGRGRRGVGALPQGVGHGWQQYSGAQAPAPSVAYAAGRGYY